MSHNAVIVYPPEPTEDFWKVVVAEKHVSSRHRFSDEEAALTFAMQHARNLGVVVQRIGANGVLPEPDNTDDTSGWYQQYDVKMW